MTGYSVSAKPGSRPSLEQAAAQAGGNMPPNPSPKLADDLLRGADEIAEFLFGDRKHRRKVYYLAGEGKIRLPHFKLGSVLCARRSSLLRWIVEQEGRQ